MIWRRYDSRMLEVPHDFLLPFLFLFLSNHYRFDDGPFLRSEVRQVRPLFHVTTPYQSSQTQLSLGQITTGSGRRTYHFMLARVATAKRRPSLRRFPISTARSVEIRTSRRRTLAAIGHAATETSSDYPYDCLSRRPAKYHSLQLPIHVILINNRMS